MKTEEIQPSTNLSPLSPTVSPSSFPVPTPPLGTLGLEFHWILTPVFFSNRGGQKIFSNIEIFKTQGLIISESQLVLRNKTFILDPIKKNKIKPSRFCLPDYCVLRYTVVSNDKSKLGQPGLHKGAGGGVGREAGNDVLNPSCRVFQAAVMSSYRSRNNSSLAKRNSPFKH